MCIRDRRELEDLLATSQSPFPKSEGFSVHELIDPRETRPKLAAWLDLAIGSQTEPAKPFFATMRP